MAVIEYALDVLGLQKTNSTEMKNDTVDPVVIFMPDGSKTHLGGIMRLGTRKTVIDPVISKHSLQLYTKFNCLSPNDNNANNIIDERHRHRYEVNSAYVDKLESAGLKFVGKDETGERMEIFELLEHPFYVGVQFHPEFKSRPMRPAALFVGLLDAAVRCKID